MTTNLKKLLGEAGAGLDSSHGSTTLYELLEAMITQMADVADKFNNHTHAADGAEAGAYNTSRPQSDTEDKTQGTPSAITALVAVE